ncbi:fucolectin-6-like [Anguilla rostrata]|uniref:fucolectin-6-like n=1 Tax=Anguilla rostrata TaxID=7938 RepID=UPI0030D144A7
MKFKTIMLLFQILAISTIKSADVPDGYVEENVALRGKATQLDQLQGKWDAFSHASNAIDGNRDSYFFHGSCSHSAIGPNRWWRVDLLQEYQITSVTITNRGDCCGERISGARILIGKHLKNNGINNPQCSVIGYMAAGETRTFYCPYTMTGRYVTVFHPRPGFLHLCEVEVNALLSAK